MIYGTYLGEAGQAGSAVTADDSGNVYVALFGARPGQASQCSFGGYSSAIEVLNPAASAVLALTYLRSGLNQLSLDSNGSIHAVGTTDVTSFFATPGAYQSTYPGSSGATTAVRVDVRLSSSEPEVTCAVNAAAGGLIDNPFGAVAPGEILTIFGKRFSSGIKVTFDTYPAPILYADANQINAVVPFEVRAPSTVVSVQGTEGRFTLPVWPAVPALFTANGRGLESLAALNEDGSVNSTGNPANAGSVVSVYMTGLGSMTPPIGDGQLGPLQPPFPEPVLGVGATVDSRVTQVLFAGQAPGLIAGAVQVNVRIPSGTAKGDARLIVYVGNYRSQLGLTTIAVQ